MMFRGKSVFAAAVAAVMLATSTMAGAAEPAGAMAATGSRTLPISMVAKAGSGSLNHASGVTKLSKKQATLLKNYMHAYYTSLVEMKVQDFSGLFETKATKQLNKEKAILNAAIGIREAQKMDLSLRDYSFKLTVQSVSKKSGVTTVQVRENYVQNFAAYPDVDASGYNILHTFQLTNKDGWRIKSHTQWGSLDTIITGGKSSPSASTLKKNVKNLLSDCEKAVKNRSKQGKDGGPVQYDYEYNRSAAVKYANKYANTRNRDGGWPVYDGWGGNCMNFVSQSIYAGGIPMDYTSPGQWKWYGGTPNNAFEASGRSGSWSSVSEFLTYVNQNQGYGMVAQANAPFYSGEVGDIIHLGTSKEWRHTVMITKVITDKKGNTVDYLVASNTNDLKNFPVSAYYYTTQQLIKIYGWNEA